MNRQTFARSAMAVAVSAAVAGIYLHSSGAGTDMPAAKAAIVATAPLALVASVTNGATAVATDFSSIVERAGPAVVNISVTSKTNASPLADIEGSFSQRDPNDPFSEFFKRFAPQL